MSEPAIDLRGLQHRDEPDLVLRDVELRIEPGEIFGFESNVDESGKFANDHLEIAASLLCVALRPRSAHTPA